MRVGTDPTLTMKTRRGTGYYKIPSLKGVWYRGPFEHNGSVATLEDWFNPARLNDDYVPTGWIGSGVKTRAVKGHIRSAESAGGRPRRTDRVPQDPVGTNRASIEACSPARIDT